MKSKMINCASCGAEIASSARACPQCGAKVKHPITKKWWFWALAAVVVIAIVGSTAGGSNDKPQTEKPSPSQTEQPTDMEPTGKVEYTHYQVTELFDALEANAMKAQSDFKDQYVEIEGYLSVIDSNGSYIGVGAAPDNYTYILQNVQCYIKNDTQKQQLMEMSTDSPITVRGKITAVGEVMGFSMNIDSIN